MYSFQTVLSKIQLAKTTDFGDLFNDSIVLFKKVWLQGLQLQLFSFLIMLPFIISFYGPYLKLALDNSSNGPLDPAVLSQSLIEEFGSSLVWVYVLMLTLSIVSSLMYLGFFRILKRIDHGQSFAVTDFFHFFQKALIGKSVVFLLAYVGIAIVATLLCFFPIVYAIIPLMFMLPIFVYNPNLTISEVVKTGFALGNKKWGITFLTLVLNTILLYVVILVTFGLGSLFFGCFLYLPQYIIYKKVIGFETSESATQTADL